MRYAILGFMIWFVATTAFAGEVNLTLANRGVLINQMKNDNALTIIVRDAITNTTGTPMIKAQAVMQALPLPIMTWLDSKLTYDKVVKITTPPPESIVTYWHKVRQLKLVSESTQIDVPGNTALKTELEALKAKTTQEYNARINAIQAQIDAIPDAVEDSGE